MNIVPFYIRYLYLSSGFTLDLSCLKYSLYSLSLPYSNVSSKGITSNSLVALLYLILGN
jgi:hypothetical protein